MALQELAIRVWETVESSHHGFMVVEAIAAGAYGGPRSTLNVDLLVGVTSEHGLSEVRAQLAKCAVRSTSRFKYDYLVRAALGGIPEQSAF